MHTKYNTLSTSKYFYITSNVTKKKQDGKQGRHSQKSSKVMGWQDNQGIMLQFFKLLQFINNGSGIHPAFYSTSAKGFFLLRVKQQ